jgi:subtilisin family serine protease
MHSPGGNIWRRIYMLLMRALCLALAPSCLLATVLFARSVRAADPAPARAVPDSRQKQLFEKLQVDAAWKVTQGDSRVVVGVIDNGFDFYHPDLKGQVEPGYYYSGGFHPDVYVNLAHGTLVASLIVARGQGKDSMSGLAPQCKVLTACQGTIEHKMLKLQKEFFEKNPKATMQEFFTRHIVEIAPWAKDFANYQATGAAEAIRYLTDRGVRVINFSGGLRHSLVPSKETWTKLEEAFAYAASKNVIIVISAGNDGARTEDYPGNAKTVIVAGATLLDDKRWEKEMDLRGVKVKQGSNFGNRLTCMAPVEDLLVCAPHEKRVYESGDGPYGAMKENFKGLHDVLKIGATSSAAPIVSALAALVFSARPDLDAPTVVELIQKGCDDLGDPGFDVYTGYGRINFAKTLELAAKRDKK